MDRCSRNVVPRQELNVGRRRSVVQGEAAAGRFVRGRAHGVACVGPSVVGEVARSLDRILAREGREAGDRDDPVVAVVDLGEVRQAVLHVGVVHVARGVGRREHRTGWVRQVDHGHATRRAADVGHACADVDRDVVRMAPDRSSPGLQQNRNLRIHQTDDLHSCAAFRHDVAVRPEGLHVPPGRARTGDESNPVRSARVAAVVEGRSVTRAEDRVFPTVRRGVAPDVVVEGVLIHVRHQRHAVALRGEGGRSGGKQDEGREHFDRAGQSRSRIKGPWSASQDRMKQGRRYGVTVFLGMMLSWKAQPTCWSSKRTLQLSQHWPELHQF